MFSKKYRNKDELQLPATEIKVMSRCLSAPDATSLLPREQAAKTNIVSEVSIQVSI